MGLAGRETFQPLIWACPRCCESLALPRHFAPCPGQGALSCPAGTSPWLVRTSSGLCFPATNHGQPQHTRFCLSTQHWCWRMPSLRLDPPPLPASPTAGDRHFCPDGHCAGGARGRRSPAHRGHVSLPKPPPVPWPQPQVAPDPTGRRQPCQGPLPSPALPCLDSAPPPLCPAPRAVPIPWPLAEPSEVAALPGGATFFGA